MKKIFFNLALCGATAWAQSSNYSDRMDENVKRFVEKQKNSTQNIKISSNKDILGRSLNGSKPLVFKVNPADYQTKKVVLTEFSNNNTANYKAIYKRVERTDNSSKFFIDGTEVSKSDFHSIAKKHRKDYLKGIRNSSSTRILNLTAQEIENEVSKNKNVFISEYQEPELLASNGTSPYIIDYKIRNRSGITNNALSKGFKGQNINILFRENSILDCDLVYNLSNFTWLGNSSYMCTQGPNPDMTHAANVYNVLHATAPEANIYGINSTPTESIIEAYDIHIINWSIAFGKSPNYHANDKIVDKLIYNTRTIGIAAAGNNGYKGFVASPSKGFNVISVGAVQPTTDYVYYNITSSKNGTQFNNDKPEIVNYVDFRFPNGLEFSGTSAASPYTAGMVADLLSQFPELKWEPATVKAALLTWCTRAVNNPDFDKDISDFKAQIPFYQKEPMNWVYSMWNGLTNNDFFNKNNKIIFTDSFTKGKRYRVAISWLTNGEYKDTDDSISQDLNLIIKRNGKIIASSLSKNNTFELIDFEAPYTGEYTIEIFRYKNRNTNEKVAIGYSRLEVQ